ncbi:MAG: hypothetical protein ACJ75J_07970 [Cytophagaceae bacterium]
MKSYFYLMLLLVLSAACDKPVNPKLKGNYSHTVSVFPNPASNYVTINAYTNSNPVYCEIRILDGKNSSLIYSGTSINPSVTLNLSGYQSQTIIAQVLIDNKLEEHQIVIIH